MGKNDFHTHEAAGHNYHDISSGASTSYYESALRLMHGEVVRFAIEKDNVANADLYIRRYNSSGVLQDSPILIEGDDGAITFAPTGEINFNASQVWTLAAADTISIDAGTTDHTAATVFTTNLDVNSASCVLFHGTIDIGTLLSAGEIVKGTYYDITEAVVNEDTSQIIAYDTALTGFATGRADLVGYKALIDGSKTGGDTETGLLVDINATVNHSGEILRGYWFDGTGMTLTDGTIYGAYIDMTFNNGSTAYGLAVLTAANTSAGILVDCGTTDSTGASAIQIDFDVNSASANAVTIDLDIGTALSSAEIARAISVDVDGLGTDAADSEVTGVYLTSAKTTTAILTAIEVEGTWDNVITMGITGAPLTVTTYQDHIINCYATSASADAGNSVNFLNFDFTMTGAGGVGGRAYFNLNTDVVLGGWSNALKGQVTYGATGGTTGMGSAVCAELQLSAGTSSGTYAALEAEIVAGAGCSTGTGTSFIYFNGTDASGLLNDNAFLFEIGAIFTSEAGHLWYDNQKAAPAVEEFVRVKTPSGTRYLALYDANA